MNYAPKVPGTPLEDPFPKGMPLAWEIMNYELRHNLSEVIGMVRTYPALMLLIAYLVHYTAYGIGKIGNSKIQG